MTTLLDRHDLVLADLDAKGEASILVRRLRGR